MNPGTSKSLPAVQDLRGTTRLSRRGLRDGRERARVMVLCAVIAWFYVWTVRSNGAPWNFGQEQRDYYNLLIDGWLEGQLHMKVEVPEALRALKDPYDPAQRPPGVGLHDASYYKGKYYVYFGAAPVLTLMLPFRVVTGVDLPLPAAVLGFVYGGFLASLLVWRAVRRRYFADTPAVVMLAGTAVLGFAVLGPVLLRRADMWELPIAAGYCFALLAVGCGWRSLHAAGEAGRARWLAGAGACLGLAIASRPTYLFAGLLLAVPLVTWGWRLRRLPWRETIHALVPLAVIGGAMAWHNQARFDDPLQFGQAYQFSLDYESKLPHFGTRYVPYNVEQHFFGAARWSRYFPFVEPPEFAPAPAGYTVHRGDVYGVLTNLPVAWLVLFAPLACWRRAAEERARLGAWLGAVAGLFAGPAVVMLAFFSALARYQMEFVPALMLLAVVGLLAVVRWANLRGPWTMRVVASGAVIAAVWSAGFGILASLSYERLLESGNPTAAHEVARRLNRIPALWERVTGVEHGAIEMILRLPAAPREGDEMLLTAGEPELRDRVFLRSMADGRVRVGFQHGEAPERLSEPLVLARDGAHRVRVTMGSLYPPAAHPFFGDRTEDEILRLKRRMQIEVNGTVVLQGHYRFASDGVVSVGREAGFTGVVEEMRRVGAVALADLAGEVGPAGDMLRLRVRWPRGRSGAREPLVVTGQTGAGDLLFVEYGEEGALRFGLDHWGTPWIAGEMMRTGFEAEQEVEITMGSLATVRDATRAPRERPGRLRVRLNGRVVLESDAYFHTAEPEEVAVGRNPIGGTSCGPAFTGEMLTIERVGP